jgi:Right handed beta helix region
MSRICRFSLVFLVALVTLPSWASSTYTVGQCVPNVGGFITIMDALTYHPPPTVVKVCPGTYNEQIEITNPVTLEGISDGTSTQVIIAPQGFVENAVSTDGGESIAAVVFVNGATGPVNISDITVDGAGKGNLGFYSFVAGVLYQNTPGTVKDVTARNLQNNDQQIAAGVGIWLEGGPSTPQITVEGCSIHDFDYAGVRADLQLNVTATKNNIYNPLPGPDPTEGATGVSVEGGMVTTISENIIQGGLLGIGEGSSLAGTISNNIVIDTQYGISTGDDGLAVTGNKIIGSKYQAIQVLSAANSIKGNTIVGA